MSPSFLNKVFHKNISNSHDLQNHKELYSRNPKTIRYGTETVSYRAPKIWSKVSETVKMRSSLESLSQKYANGNQNAIATFVQHICTILVLLMLFNFSYFGFVKALV